MARQAITAPEYPTQSLGPDSPYDSWVDGIPKINDNFTELYSGLARPAVAAYAADSSALAHTVAAADISGGNSFVVLNMTGALGQARDLSMPTVANLVAALGYTPVAGSSWMLRIINSSSGNFAWTITKTADSSNWTLTGTQTINQNTFRDFVLRFTSATAATLTSVGTGTWS